jgi:DNA-binding beta-propeller fold protein YncE
MDPRETRTLAAAPRLRASAAVLSGRSSLAGCSVSSHPAGALPEGDAPAGVAFTPDGAEILIAHWESRNVIVWDASSGAFVREIPVSGSPMGVAVSADGLHAVTPNAFEDTASILDLALGMEVAVVPVGDQPGVVAISPDGTTAAVGNTVGGSLSIIHIGAGVELRRASGIGFTPSLGINFENASLGVRFTQPAFAGNGKIVHPDLFADRLRIVDVATGAVTSVVVPDGPEGVAVSASGATAILACGDADSVAVVDVASATLTKSIAVGADVFGGAIALDPTAGKAIVTVLNACLARRGGDRPRDRDPDLDAREPGRDRPRRRLRLRRGRDQRRRVAHRPR